MSSRFHRFPTTDHSSMLDQAIDIHKRSVSNEFEDWNTSARTVKFSGKLVIYLIMLSIFVFTITLYIFLNA